MFAKQTILSASLVATCSAALIARAETEVSLHGDDEVAAPGTQGAEAPAPRPPPPQPPPPAPRRPTGTFVVGAGYSGIEGFIATATIAQDDLFGTGNHLSLNATISARRQLFLMRFADPDLFGSKLALSADLFNDERLLPGFIRKAAGGAITLSYPIAEHVRVFAGYRLEQVEVEGDALARSRTVETAPPLRGGRISALRTGLVYSTLDRTTLPTRGTSIGGSIEIADRQLGSEINFRRMHAWAHTHQPIGPLTLHVGGRVTSIASRDPYGLPRNERLFLDSAHEIRGFRPESFSPVDALGTPIGGDMKLTGSIELEVPLVRRIGLSAIGFADVGGLFDRRGRGVVGRSAGFGFLWRSPIGPLRFDWAFPLDGGKHSFLFGIGSTF